MPIRSDLAGAIPASVSDRLLELYPGRPISISRQTDGALAIEGVTNAEIDQALVDWSPATGSDEQYVPPFPPHIRTHLNHIRDFETAVRSGTQAGKTSSVRLSEMEHVVADVIGLIRLLDPRT